VLKEVNRALNGNRPEAYRLPDTDQLVAQELLLFEMSGSDDLERIVSTDLRAVRMTLTSPFDFSTMMVGSIALGLLVDDTIHFLHAFNRELERSGDVRAATRHTLLTTGRAMFVTSLTLVAGFLAYTQATLQNLANFGTLTAAVIVLALLADFTFVPALLSILKRVPAR
jgi:predicted RND superfamily exporter protein